MRWHWEEVEKELKRIITLPSVTDKLNHLIKLKRCEREDVLQEVKIYIFECLTRWPPPSSVSLRQSILVLISGFYQKSVYLLNMKKRTNSQKELLFADMFPSGEEMPDIEEWVVDFSSPEDIIIEREFLDFLKNRLEQKEWQSVLNFLERTPKSLGGGRSFNSRLKEKISALIEEYNK